MADTNNNPFDFSNVDDLPEELQARLRRETSNNAAIFAGVVHKGAEAGYPSLDINQIMAAASRMGIDVPTQQTVRGYLNKAIEEGSVAKTSRQTYGPGAKAPAEVEPVEEEEAEEPKAAPKRAPGKAKADESDPLADI